MRSKCHAVTLISEEFSRVISLTRVMIKGEGEGEGEGEGQERGVRVRVRLVWALP